MCSYIFPLLAGRIFSRCFGVSCFIRIVWSCLGIFLVFFLVPVPSDWLRRAVSSILIVLVCSFRPNIFLRFSCLSIFAYSRFLICVSSLISHLGFEFLFMFFRGTPILVLTNFAPASMTSFNSVMLFIKICFNNLFVFFSFGLDSFPVLFHVK